MINTASSCFNTASSCSIVKPGCLTQIQPGCFVILPRTACIRLFRLNNREMDDDDVENTFNQMLSAADTPSTSNNARRPNATTATQTAPTKPAGPSAKKVVVKIKKAAPVPTSATSTIPTTDTAPSTVPPDLTANKTVIELKATATAVEPLASETPDVTGTKPTVKKVVVKRKAETKPSATDISTGALSTEAVSINVTAANDINAITATVPSLASQKKVSVKVKPRSKASTSAAETTGTTTQSSPVATLTATAAQEITAALTAATTPAPAKIKVKVNTKSAVVHAPDAVTSALGPAATPIVPTFSVDVSASSSLPSSGRRKPTIDASSGVKTTKMQSQPLPRSAQSIQNGASTNTNDTSRPSPTAAGKPRGTLLEVPRSLLQPRAPLSKSAAKTATNARALSEEEEEED